MSTVYDKTHELAKMIEQEENYTTVKQLTEKVMSNSEHMELIENFRRKQYEIQRKQFEGKPLEESEVSELNNLYEKISTYEEIKKLIDAEERLSILFQDLNRILTEPLEKIYRKE